MNYETKVSWEMFEMHVNNYARDPKAWAAIIGARGTSPQKFCLGTQTQASPQQLLLLVKILFFSIFLSSDFSSSLQNAYSSEELNGLLYYQNSIFFQLQPLISAPGPRWGLCPRTPGIGSHSALATSSPTV